MTQLQQAQAGHAGQQGAIGQGPGIVRRLRFAAKGKGHRLGGLGARQLEGGVPDQRQGERQQQRKGQAGRQRRLQPGRQALDRHRTQPVRQQRGFGGQATQGGGQPGRAAFGHGQHVAVGGQVGIAPGVAAEQAGQHISGAEQQQHQARQAFGAALGHQGRGGLAHRGRACAWAAVAAAAWRPRKKAAKAAFVGSGKGLKITS